MCVWSDLCFFFSPFSFRHCQKKTFFRSLVAVCIFGTVHKSRRVWMLITQWRKYQKYKMERNIYTIYFRATLSIAKPYESSFTDISEWKNSIYWIPLLILTTIINCIKSNKKSLSTVYSDRQALKTNNDYTEIQLLFNLNSTNKSIDANGLCFSYLSFLSYSSRFSKEIHQTLCFQKKDL